MSQEPRTFALHRTEDETGVSGTGVVAHGVIWPDGTVALRWCVGEHHSTVIHASIEAVEAIHGHGGKTRVAYADEDFPRPDLSRLAEFEGYMQQLAADTGDDGPLEFWREIRRSINAPIRDRIRQATEEQA